jgi:prepilin-type processing-associated H-X9-DG protein
MNNLKNIGLALHNYATANKVFPPGTICSTAPIAPGNQYDVWGEAGRSGHGFYGTGLLLRILPFIEYRSMAWRWDFSYGVSGGTVNTATAINNFEPFYCPSRRAGLRQGDNAMMLSLAWTGGGTDYGGCAGRHAAFSLSTGYNLCDATMHYRPSFKPVKAGSQADDAKPETSWGIFGKVNGATTFGSVRDGLSNTIMTGELQRITDTQRTSKDGWAIGGPASLFTTGAMFQRDGKTLTCVDSPAKGKLMNNGFFGSPGSDHPRGANFGLGDGSVRFIFDSIDPNIFAFAGSMADGIPIAVPD